MGRDQWPPGGDGARPKPGHAEPVAATPQNTSQHNPQDNRIEAFDESAARQLDNDIRALARHVHIALEALMVLVADAKANDIHTHLGFPSWTAYLADALDGQWRIERDKRGEVIRFLADQGMSTRAIARMTGMSKDTAARELAGIPLGPVVGLDGKTYPRPEAGVADATPDEEPDDEFLARMDAEHAARLETDPAERAVTIPATIPAAIEKLVELDAQIDRHEKDARRLQRIVFDRAFARLAQLPKGYERDVGEVGLYFRWMQTVVGWGLDDGQSIEEIADEMGVSVEMVEDYLDAPTSSTAEFIAKVCRL